MSDLSSSSARADAWRAQLARAAHLAGTGLLEGARTTYRAVHVEIEETGGKDATAKILAADAIGGLAWVERQSVTGEAPALWQKARALATEAVEAALASGDKSVIAHALFVRARACLELSEPLDAFDDLAGAEAILRDPSAQGDREGIRLRLAHAMKDLGQASIAVPARCHLCGITAGIASVLLSGPGIVICQECAVEAAAAKHQLAPRTSMQCGLCGEWPPRLVAWCRTAICTACIAGIEWVFTSDGPAPETCSFCDAPSSEETSIPWTYARICIGCEVDFLARFESTLPRSGRERQGPLVRGQCRCTLCGKRRARGFLFGTSSRAICDECVDHGEAIFASRPEPLLTAPPSERKEAAAVGLDVATLEILVGDGRTELLKSLAIASVDADGGKGDVERIDQWLARLDAAASAIAPEELAIGRCALHHRLCLCGDRAAVSESDRERAAHFARIAIAEGLGRAATRDLVVVLTTLYEKRPVRPAFDELGAAFTALVTDIAAATPSELADLFQKLGRLHKRAKRKHDAAAAFARARTLVEYVADDKDTQQAQTALAGVLIDIGNMDPPNAVELYDQAAAIHERYIDHDKWAVTNFVIAQENAARAFELSGDRENRIARLERAREVLIGAVSVYEGLDARKTEVEKKLARALRDGERWQDAAEVAWDALLAIRDQGGDVWEMSDLRHSALNMLVAKENRELTFCSICDGSSDDAAITVSGSRVAACWSCIEDAQPADDDAETLKCWMCGADAPIDDVLALGNEERMCTTCMERCTRHLDATNAEGTVVWIDPTVLKHSCSFCEKTQREVKKIIAGPSCNICDECVGLCNDIIAESDGSDGPRPKSAVSDGRTCAFCSKNVVWKLIAGPNVHICDECVGLCNDIIAEEVQAAQKEQG